MKKIILLLILLTTAYATAQQASYLVCTPHRNELAAMGFANIFHFEGKYCVYLGDNSYEVIEQALGDIESVLTNSWLSLLEFIYEGESWSVEDVTKDVCDQKDMLCDREEDEETFEEWQDRRAKEFAEGKIDEFVNWETGENPTAKYKPDPGDYQESHSWMKGNPLFENCHHGILGFYCLEDHPEDNIARE